MECNKDEAMRAKEIAEKKMENNDFQGAQRIATKAQNLYPELENINQLLTICEVHCSAQSSLLGSEKDWYAILKVERFADELAVKKQYRRLALVLHPDKNRFPGAEAAFKLICEANAVLSDPTKKSLFDNKIRVLVRSAPGNQSPHYINRNSQLNRQYGAQNSVPNSSSSLNQPPQSTSVKQDEKYWTSCSFCGEKYQYPRKYLTASMVCLKCKKRFMMHEIGAQGKTSASAQHVPPKPVSSKSDAFKEKEVPNQGNSKVGVKNSKGSSTSHAGSQGTAQTARAAKVSENLEAQKTDTSLHGKMESGKTKGNTIKKETRDLKNKNKKRGRKIGVESSESYTSGQTDTDDVTVKGDFGDNAADKSESSKRRSSRKRQDVSYKEPDGDGQKDAQESLREKKNDFDAVQIESDPDQDSISKSSSEEDMLECPDPEFTDFDKDRDESRFTVNQFWACYDTFDSMPRFYAKVRKVRVTPSFELNITWLEAVPIDRAYENWVDKELPVGCGSFKLGKTEKTDIRMSFSHQVHCEKGKKRGSLFIYPRRGEVWALLRGWDPSWADQENHKEFKYEIVEILSDFVAGCGIKVCYLDKVEGFVSLFQRASHSEANSFLIHHNELYRFSHLVPFSKMMGSEREGVPIGSYELDPACLPLNPEYLHYPGKAKLESRNNMDNTEFHSLLSKSDKKKDNPVVSEGLSTPKKAVDAVLRRSPRGQNVQKNTN